MRHPILDLPMRKIIQNNRIAIQVYTGFVLGWISLADIVGAI